MPLDQVAELARHAASDAGILNALRDDPASVRGPLNLSDAQLRALISAGSFTTARPAATTSRSEPSEASAIAALEVGTLFPPEGQGQFPAPGELPPIVVAPHTVPTSPPKLSQPPKSVPSRPPSSDHPPVAAAPNTGRTPSAGQVPQVAPRTPQAAPHAPQSAGSPQPQHGTPGGIAPRAVTPRAFTPAVSQPPSAPGAYVTPKAPTAKPAGSGSNGRDSGVTQPESSGEGQTIGQQTFFEQVSTPQPCECDCGVCETAIVSIVAEVSAAAQTAIASITAIAGLD